ncbi:hypothetical protein K4K58_009154 [Colletotrichum sp. SAR11_239]|nr:hypothetical protein K4K58_009154 [Colletotrichum sp. SAR11_239]
MDESLNSSDVEVDDPAPSRFAAAGGRSLKKIVSGAPDDRLASKKAVKELQLQHRTPGSEYQTVLWSTRFQTFRQVTLKKDPKSVPTAEDLERFIHSVPSKINGQSEEGKVSHGYIMNGVKWILKWMNFHWREGKLDSHDRARIDSTLLTLLQNGALTRERSRGDRLWITNDVVRRMIGAILSDAIVNGSYSWDATILRVLSILVPAALGARSGDVSRSHYYKGDEYTKWEDVYIRLNDDGLMFGSIILKYTKGAK